MSTIDPDKLSRRLSTVKNILLVLSGKGGVGKSSMSVQLALSLLSSSTSPSSTPMKIGLLDIDLTGPSVPRMLGLDGMSVHQSNDGWVPVYLPIHAHHASSSSTSAASSPVSASSATEEGKSASSVEHAAAAHTASEAPPARLYRQLHPKDEFKVMSIGFLLQNSRQAVVWRGPKKSAMIRQFLADVRWGDLDWLVIDTPPGMFLSVLFFFPAR